MIHTVASSKRKYMAVFFLTALAFIIYKIKMITSTEKRILGKNAEIFGVLTEPAKL
jgi:hypothetical protein